MAALRSCAPGSMAAVSDYGSDRGSPDHVHKNVLLERAVLRALLRRFAQPPAKLISIHGTFELMIFGQAYKAVNTGEPVINPQGVVFVISSFLLETQPQDCRVQCLNYERLVTVEDSVDTVHTRYRLEPLATTLHMYPPLRRLQNTS